MENTQEFVANYLWDNPEKEYAVQILSSSENRWRDIDVHDCTTKSEAEKQFRGSSMVTRRLVRISRYPVNGKIIPLAILFFTQGR